MGIGQERSAGIRNGRAPALLPHAPHPELLGPAIMLVWTQCMLYARYLWVDAGVTTVAINYARCAFIAVLALIALSGRFTSRFQDVLGRVSVVLMTLGSLVFYLMGYFDEPPWMMLLAAVLAGVGVTWGEGMWIKAYMRLSAREVLFYSLASLASWRWPTSARSSTCGSPPSTTRVTAQARRSTRLRRFGSATCSSGRRAALPSSA